MDSIASLFASFPTIIGISFSVMSLILFFTFKSLMAPLCFILEVLLTMVFFYGIATYLFQYGQINGNDGLYWATIFIMFSLSIGLCSDYFVFRFTGINAEYKICKNAKKAVVDASENMGVVMVAGLIMIVSFSGLLFSSLDMLLQFGVCLITSLAFDTLIVVPILVPSVSVLCGKAMFWPGRLWPQRVGVKYDLVSSANIDIDA